MAGNAMTIHAPARVAESSETPAAHRPTSILQRPSSRLTWLFLLGPALVSSGLLWLSYFPVNCGKARGNEKAFTGSDGVMNFIKSAGANGSIGLEEYSYPKQAGFPSANM